MNDPYRILKVPYHMLTPTQIDARKGKLTASRVACLMRGDKYEIDRLYLEMIGEQQPDDLRHVWTVRLGEATEQLNLDWFEEKNRMEVTLRGQVQVHVEHTWAACTLDGWVTATREPIECKCVGGREPLEVVIERYQPQMQWIMFVTEAVNCILSVIIGANEPIVEVIDRDEDYITEMVKRGKQFMWHVENRVPPVALEPVPPPIDATKVYDMSSNNQWMSSAFEWLETVDEAKANKDAEKVLKSLVPTDGAKAFGGGVQISRNRAGALSLRKQS
jgi:predicted phage-related endonuclease